MVPETERATMPPDPPDISLQRGEETCEWVDKDGKTHEVTTEILHALQEPYRGQAGFGEQHRYLRTLFHDVPEYVVTLQPEKSCKVNVRTVLT